MHEHVQRPSLSSLDRPDGIYAFVVGLYVAVFVTPALVIGLDQWVTGDAGVLYVSLLVAVTVVTTLVGLGVRRLRGLPERLGSSRLVWVLAFGPIPVAMGYLAVGSLTEPLPVEDTALVGFALGLVGVFLGIALVTMSRSRYTAAVVDEATVTTEWTAGWPEPDRRRGRYVAVVLFGAAIAAIVAGGALRIDWLRYAGQMLVPVPVVLFNAGQARTFRVAPAGLEPNYGVGRHLYHWDSFESFEVTDGTLLIHWASWWRPATRCDLTDIENPETVEDALAEYLPRA